MTQYIIGTVAVTNGSATVTGTGTLWVTNGVAAGNGFTIVDSGVSYTVASIVSETQLTLSSNYAGSTLSGLSYAIFNNFTSPDNIPELNKGDIETSTIWTRAVRKIQDLITGIVTGTKALTAVNITGGVAALTSPSSVTVNSPSTAFTVTQAGTGNSFVVEDSNSPDSTPFIITSIGNVGIGTTAPTAQFAIAGTTPRMDFYETDGTAGFAITSLVTGTDLWAIQTRDSVGNYISNNYLLTHGASGATRHEWRISGSQALSIDSTKSVAIGSAALATTATDGFLYIPTCAGTPTGVPTVHTGRVPIIFDTTNNKLWIYDTSWLGSTFA